MTDIGTVDKAAHDDSVVTVGGLTVMVPADSVDKLQGATLDLPQTAGQGGMVIRNPNRPDPLAGVELDLHGDIAEKVTQLLEQAVNPALAAHGGKAQSQAACHGRGLHPQKGGRVAGIRAGGDLGGPARRLRR